MAVDMKNAAESIMAKVDRATKDSTMSDRRLPFAIGAVAEAVLLLAAVLQEKP